jgi:type III pantothenate kinase
VGIAHRLETPGTTGADRALNVLAARTLMSREGRDGPGIVVSCGTALVVERIDGTGTWDGGAIATGLGLASRSLHELTAQLPMVRPGESAPRPFGPSTATAIAAGVFWGVVGAARELIARQSEGLAERPWRIWTGGDAARIAAAVDGDGARVEPDLVIRGLAELVDSDLPS